MSNPVSVPARAEFDLELTKVIKAGNCPQSVANIVCRFAYNWDFEKNEGLAYLKEIGGSPVDVTLHPLGVVGTLSFMSDIEPFR